VHALMYVCMCVCVCVCAWVCAWVCVAFQFVPCVRARDSDAGDSVSSVADFTVLLLPTVSPFTIWGRVVGPVGRTYPPWSTVLVWCMPGKQWLWRAL
jgi:hypothetical protein